MLVVLNPMLFSILSKPNRFSCLHQFYLYQYHFHEFAEDSS
nr:MAG TPA: hypothetical protein [Bacteriophage sp.]